MLGESRSGRILDAARQLHPTFYRSGVVSLEEHLQQDVENAEASSHRAYRNLVNAKMASNAHRRMSFQRDEIAVSKRLISCKTEPCTPGHVSQHLISRSAAFHLPRLRHAGHRRHSTPPSTALVKDDWRTFYLQLSMCDHPVSSGPKPCDLPFRGEPCFNCSAAQTSLSPWTLSAK